MKKTTKIVIGRNGRGKTTFLKLLNREFTYSRQITSAVNFDYFPMNIENETNRALEVMKSAIVPFKK